MPKTKLTMKAKVWFYEGKAGWHFLSLPKAPSDAIRKNFGPLAKAWGSLPVTVTIGKTSWDTSLFPDTNIGAYLLPLKADARRKANIQEGDTITFRVELRIP